MSVESQLRSFGAKLGVVVKNCSGQPELEDDEQTQSVSSSVTLMFDASSDAGPGTLYITTRRVIWVNSSTTVALNYQQIVMHAISRDTSSCPRPCIYLQLDNGSEEMPDQSHDEEEDEEEMVDAEVRLVPEDSEKVEELFKALCECAALNPDPEAEGEGDFYFDEGEVMGGLDEEARADLLARQAAGMELEEGREELGELVGDDPGRFDDDEEEEEDEGGPLGNGHMEQH